MSIYTENLLRGMQSGYGGGRGYNPYQIHAAVLGEASGKLAARRWKDQFEEGRRQFQKSYELKSRDLDEIIKERERQYQLDLKELTQRQNEFKTNVAANLFQSGAGTPSERIDWMSAFGFSDEPRATVPGAGNIYGSEAVDYKIGEGQPLSAGGTGGGNLADKIRNIAALESMATQAAYSKGFGSGIGPAAQRHGELMNKVRQLTRTL